MKKIVLLISMIFMLTLAACSAPVEEPGFEAEKINVYTRDTSSGTRDGFMRGIGFADAAANDSLLVAGFITADNNAIMSAMATDKAGSWLCFIIIR
jgi:phosphate transport system substrate-binding protein